MTSSTDRARLARHERAQARVRKQVEGLATTPRLARSSIDGGALELRDVFGNTTGYVGEQYDGSFTVAPVGGTYPSQPSPLLVTPVQGGLTVYWDGTYADGSVTRMDFKRVTIHAVTALEDLDVLSPSQIVGEITTATGGEASASLPPIEHFVVAVTWTDSGKFSEESDPAFGTPLAVADTEEWLAHEEAIAGRVKLSYDPVQPTPGPDELVLWFDADLKQHYWDGTSWSDYQLGPNAIAPRSIITEHINAGAIVGELIDVEVLRAGFTLTGRIQVGESTWTPTEGLVIPQVNGGRIHLPADGVTPARFDGHVNAKSATIENNLNVMGAANKINGGVTLANGITEPTVAPAAWADWSSVFSGVVDGSGVSWRYNAGVAPHHSNSSLAVTAISFYGTVLRFLDATTGGWAGDADLSGQTWQDLFTPFGITQSGGSYFVIGHDFSSRGGIWIYKLNSSFAKVAEIYVGPQVDFVNRTPAIATDGTRVYMLFTNIHNSNIGRVSHWDMNLTPASGLSANMPDFAGALNFSGAWAGDADLGSSRIFLLTEEHAKVYVIDPANGFSVNYSQSFPVAGNRLGRGVWWHATSGRFKSIDRDGFINTYSTSNAVQSVTVSNTWYDGAGTVRETREGPVTTFSLPARAWLGVETGVPPDSGNTDAAQVDKANRTAIYVGIGAGTRRLQGGAPLGVDANGVSYRSLKIDTIATATATAPASNTFVGGTTSTGKITSGATSGGQPLLEISGDGKINGQSIEDTGWVYPALSGGWVNQGGANVPCRYRRRNGIVYVQFAIRSGGGNVFQLPSGYRPGYLLPITGTEGSYGVSQTNILADGWVTAVAGASNARWNVVTSFPADA